MVANFYLKVEQDVQNDYFMSLPLDKWFECRTSEN